MKNHFRYLSLLIVIAGIIVSCSKSEPAPVTSPSLLSGTWLEVSEVTTGCFDPTNNKPLANCTSCETVTVIGNQITISTPGKSDSTYPYTVDGNTLTLTNLSVNPNTTQTVIYAVTSTTLTITSTDATTNCTRVTNYTKM